MGLFGRSRQRETSDADVPIDAVAPEPSEDENEGDASAAHTTGPWDEGDNYPQVARVDLGGLRIPHDERVRIQVQAEPSTGTVSQLTLLTGDSAVQVQPYAAPRTGGMWADIRQQITSSINSSGGLVEQGEGTFGTEIRAQVAGQKGTAQPARFCGIDGPRWFVRLVYLGKAAREESAAAVLDEVVRGMVVVRGGDAMPMGNAIPLRVPTNEQGVEDADSATAASPQRPTITLPQRGPEITETR